MPPGSGRTQCPAGQPAAQGYGRSPPPGPKGPTPKRGGDAPQWLLLPLSLHALRFAAEEPW